MPDRRPQIFIALSLMLAAASGCSGGEEEVPDPAAAAEFADLFSQGFSVNEQDAVQTVHDAGIRFNRSSAITRQVQDGMAANVAQNFSLKFIIADPARFIESGKVRDVWQREARARSFPEDTVAGATALLFAVGWELANGSKLSPLQNAAILKQMRAGLRDNPLAQEAEPQRQIQADMRLIVAGMWLEEAGLRAASAPAMQELSDSVHQDMVKLSSNNMRQMTVSADGFVERGGS